MSFTNIYGQDKQKAILKRALETGRVAHAYLFYGMKGIGKRTSAHTFTKALNCKEEGIPSCERCSSCKKIVRGVHPDVITIEPTGAFIKIQDIRDLQAQTKFKPFEGKKRIFIIVDAERMNSPSANALLKTLEEPNPSNILILITSRPHLLPGTIISRCQKVRFSPLRRDTVRVYLENEEGLDGETAFLLASSSGGSIGKALEMMRESYLAFKNDVVEKIVSWDRTKNPLACFSIVHDFGEGKRTISERLDILRNWYRDVLVFKETRAEDYLTNRDIIHTIRKFSDTLTGRDILEHIAAIDQASRALEQNANKQLTLESMMFKLLKL